MRRVAENFAPPAFDVEDAVHEAVANAGGGVGLLVMDDAEVIAGHMKAAAVELADPALQRDLPIRVAEKEAADDADADRLAGRGRRRQRRGGKVTRDIAGNHLAIDLLQ